MSVSAATVRSVPLLEREAELAAVDVAVARAAAGAGGVLLIEGVPGVGKSTLLAKSRASARDHGMQVLKARGAGIERGFAFGVARQLFEPVVVPLAPAERARLLAGAAALAGHLLGESAASSPGREDSEFGVLHGLYWLTVNLSDRSPLLLAVDDAQWADAASLRFLSYLSRRLEGLSVLVVATGRSSDPEGEELWHALIEDPVAEVLHPGSLSERAVATLVRSRLAREADERFCDACHRATSGNPLFLRELLTALDAADVAPTADAAAAVSGIGPRAVARFVLHRLERLGPSATALAQAVAVLGDDVDAALAAKAAGLHGEARRVADRLVQADVFAPDQLLRFVHPIVRAAVYEDLLPGERAARHLDAARLLEQAGGPPERIAAHLLKAGPTGDPHWVGVLEAAAGQACQRGDPAGAVAYLRRALQEPLSEELTSAVMCELGRVELAIREYDPAQRHLLSVLREAPQAALHARAGVWLARSAVTSSDRQAAGVAFDALVAELEVAEGEHALELEAELLTLVRLELSLRHLVPEWLERFRRDAGGDRRFEAIARIHAASEQLVRGEPAAEAGDVIEAALPSIPPSNPFAFGVALDGLILTERYTTASRWIELALEAGRAIGFRTRIANLHTQRASLALARGAVGEAQLDARTALELAGTDHFYAPRVVAVAIQAAIERGELDAAQHLVDVGGEHLARERIFVDEFLTSRGNLRVARGELRHGLADLLRCRELYASYGTARPGEWQLPAIRALASLGHRGRAEQLAREALVSARRFGTRRGLARALRVNGTLAGGESGLALLEEAVAVAKESTGWLELAYAYAEFGAEFVRLRRRREGRDVLRLALEQARECGASVLAARIRGDLGAGGGRPPRLGSKGLEALTPAERRICDLAARDMSNREVAQQLFVTEKTVELHLTNAYRKLGIRSRFQLSSVIPATAGAH